MLKLVLGGSGSGKTTLLYSRIRARAEAGRYSILLVPEQFTSSTEGRIYRELGDALSGMVESFSFTSLAERILSAEGGALALGAVHVQRQTDDDELGTDLLCHLAYPGGYLVAGLQGDLRGDGCGQELGAVAGGKAGAAVSVING